MNILYKYYSDLKLSYFDEPTFKLSQPKYLNDPFESSIQHGMIQSNSVLRKRLKKIEDARGSAAVDKLIIRNIYDLLNASGVISLSETQRNILMWAHYANEHRGLCIGYDNDPFNFKKNRPHTLRDIYYQLHKVNYDTSRYDPLNDEFKNSHSIYWINAVVKKMLTTKSDEWIYEKEHRYIHPIYDSDYFISNGLLKHNEYTREIYNSYRPTKVVFVDGDIRKYELKKEASNIQSYLNELQKLNKEITFYKKIPPKSIQTIFLGYRYPKNKEIDLIQKMYSDTCKIKHARIFRMDICPMEFRLIPKQIFPPVKSK
ncbi:DUF2971 domain-containing protein [Aeromonas caviae]